MLIPILPAWLLEKALHAAFGPTATILDINDWVEKHTQQTTGYSSDVAHGPTRECRTACFARAV